MTELEIPREAVEAACNAYEAAVQDDDRDRDPDDLSTHEEIAAVRAAAPLIVAAELERLSAECDTQALGCETKAAEADGDIAEEEYWAGKQVALQQLARDVLRARAAELRGDRKAGPR